MFQKECPNCGQTFKSKDRRQTTCGLICSKTFKLKKPKPVRVPIVLPETLAIEPRVSSSLPDPDQLPAPYAKRVYDMWRTLIGETGGARIA